MEFRKKTYFYRQSDIPEIPELMWILSTFTAKGLMNRAHAYKSVVQLNEESGGSDPDKGISMALFSYPILMAADILMFKATDVPVGQDQKQHMEMVRDVAQRFNHHYGDIFVVPQAIIAKESAILPGLDGRKMSKSYNNSIPLFLGSNELRKLIMKIKTNSLEQVSLNQLKLAHFLIFPMQFRNQKNLCCLKNNWNRVWHGVMLKRSCLFI